MPFFFILPRMIPKIETRVRMKKIREIGLVTNIARELSDIIRA